MLDTGIDVPEVVNLVFFKPVRSRTKFWQMIGRGTRLCADMFGPGRHKDFFYIFDWCRNFEYFDAHPEAAEGKAGASLGERLFAARVALLAELDRTRPPPEAGEYAQPPSPVLHLGEAGSEADRAAETEALRDALAMDLRREVEGMSLDNFLVRPKRLFVERYTGPAAWARIDETAAAELVEHLAGLPSAVGDGDLDARQFDLLVLRAQLALLRSESTFVPLRASLTALATSLEAVANIPMVAAELTLIQEMQADEYWQDITLPMLETVRRRLRALVKLVEPGRRPRVYTDFEDQAGASTEIAVAGIPVGTDLDAFRRKARHFLRPHENHLAILKLRRNEPLTPTDLAELERIFLEAGVSSQGLATLQEAGGLGRFVRSLVGLDHETAQGAFAGFIADRTLSADQIEFLDLVIGYLTDCGAMDPKLLYESPFTDFDSNGVAGVFPPAEVAEIIGVLRGIESKIAA